MNTVSDLRSALETGFILQDHESLYEYQPQLMVNRKAEKKKILGTLLQELRRCKSFKFSVAFLTMSGYAVLANTLDELKAKGVSGHILVSQYQNFTHPEALKKLKAYENIELRIATSGNFHAKGYIFEQDCYYSLIVGSSNLTASALTSNKEWNLRVTGLLRSKIVDDTLREFEYEFGLATVVTDEYIDEYRELYSEQKRFMESQQKRLEIISGKTILPNQMQISALNNLKSLRSAGKNKALLISATGTGKTYLSAFDVASVNPKRMLFLVHRANIANKALESYKKIMPERSMGVFSGSRKEVEMDYLFSTVQTVSRDENLCALDPFHFDYIVIDETHRAGAATYQKILRHFKPNFLLGMTATPERTDGFDIFNQFDYNIAYEIRLHRALEEDMLSPFHYYGVTDVVVDEKKLNGDAVFLTLTSDERVEHILEKSHKYGTDDGEMRCLVFCNSNKVSSALAKAFINKGYKALALSGDSTEEQRELAIERLESDDRLHKLDYIFSVDIFNEGVDIPRVNQIIMLRPTLSAIVFVQQLGRGLRRTEGKEYLTVIDFIGNYKNNFLVPIALYGDQSYNKDTLRKMMASESDLLPGASTVNFDRIAKERIFEAINDAKMHKKEDLVKDYELLKYQIGRIPTMMDFIEHGRRDPYLYVKAFGSYYHFVLDQEPQVADQKNLSSIQLHLLKLISQELANGKRVEEALLLKALLNFGPITKSQFTENVFNQFGYRPTEETLESVLNNVNLNYVTENGPRDVNGKRMKVRVGNHYGYELVQEIHEQFVPTKFWKTHMSVEPFKELLNDLLNFGITNFAADFDLANWRDGFVLYRKYSRKDVFRILNWGKMPVMINVGGYMVHPQLKDCAAFVNYHKEETISLSTQYEDAFMDPSHFIWMSKSNRSLASADVMAIMGHTVAGQGIRIPLFVKKHNDEGDDFYYLGELTAGPGLAEHYGRVQSKTKAIPMGMILDPPVEQGLYRYITEKT